jgi:hypothetical protein
MAVVSMMRVKGDTDQLVTGMQHFAGDDMRDLARKHGALGRIVARTDDGILVINLWERDEGRHAMAEEPAVHEALRKAGFPQPAFEGYEVVTYEFLD